MPCKLASPCSFAGCPARATNRGRCQTHARKVDSERGTSTDRGYGVNWRRIRGMFLNRHPVCQDESGCWRPATDVHHMIAKRRGGSDAFENLQSLCHAHHSAKTLRGE